MLVTTYYHPRSLPHPNAIDEIERAWPEDGVQRNILGGDDRDDLMGEFLYSSEEGETHNSVWHGPETLILLKTSRFKRRATILGPMTALKVL
jgi:hypothetical protein